MPLDLSGVCERPQLLALAAKVLAARAGDAGEADYLARLLPEIHAALRLEWIAVAQARDGRWLTLAQHGTSRSLPVEVLADALDREAVAQRGPWVAAPLGEGRTIDQLLVLHAGSQPNLPAEPLGTLAKLIGHATDELRGRRQSRRRTARLETLLEITGAWIKTHEMEPLLASMAAAATRLLEADRASIFLWDRANRVLVGRPALGIENGELRIPDDKGVVGQVVQTGQTRRVTAGENAKQINRQVDDQFGYQTRNLLCVPLRGEQGDLFGAFEVLNRRDGDFTDEDEAALVELAAQAAIALENTQQWEQLLTTHRRIVDQAASDVKLIGESPAIEALRSTIRRVADTELAVLLLGENGTGKEVASQSVHYLSRRRNQPFIAVNCAAITETLLESELFGHEKGAFTDAHEARAGKFELAADGTLFLDEIGDLSRGGQAKLLRVLEEKIVVRVGGSRPIQVNTRVVAATNQNLAEMVRQKKFREDLYFRLNVVTLELPPLRDRGDDILLLADHFLQDFCRKARRKMLKLSASARKRLLAHAWPGNVRELRNLMERLAYLTQGEKIEAEDLAFILSPNKEQQTLVSDHGPLADATVAFQTEYIRRAVDRARGNMSEAAGLLGLHRSNLYRKMRQLGMETNE